MKVFSFLVLAGLCVLPAGAEAACGSGLFRFSFAGKRIEEPLSLCFEKASGKLSSANCEAGTCLALTKDLCGFGQSAPLRGTPGAQLCHQAGGVLQRGAVYVDNEWHDADRCLFADDKSFVDSGSLSARRGRCFKK